MEAERHAQRTHGLPLDQLADRIRDARAVVVERRQARVAHGELNQAQHDLWQALEQYTSALEQRELPVPRQISAELRLYSDLFGR